MRKRVVSLAMAALWLSPDSLRKQLQHSRDNSSNRGSKGRDNSSS